MYENICTIMVSEFEWDEKKNARTKADPGRNFDFE
jgi:hypothetical protein